MEIRKSGKASQEFIHGENFPPDMISYLASDMNQKTSLTEEQSLE